MKVTVGKKLALGFGSLALLTLVVGLVGMGSLRQTHATWNKAKEFGYELSLLGRDAEKTLSEARGGVRLFRLEKEEMGIEKAKREHVDMTFVQSIAKTEELLHQMKALAQKAGMSELEKKSAESLRFVETYRASVFDFVEATVKRGDYQIGLLADLRQQILKAEEAIEKQGKTELLLSLLQCRREEKNFLLGETQDSRKYEESVKELKARVNASQLGEGEKAQLFSLVEDYENKFLQVVQSTEKLGEVAEQMRAELLKTVATVTEVYMAGETMAEEYIAKAVGFARPVNFFLGTTSFLAFFAALILGVLISRGITRPLIALQKGAEVVAQGDLTQEITVKTSDEVGDLANSFRKMVESLRGILHQNVLTAERVSSASQQLSSSAQEMNATTQEVSSTVQQIAKGSQTTAQRVEETSKVMEQMNSSVGQVATSAQQAATASLHANQTAQKGNEAAKQAIEKINRLYETINSSTQVVRKLGERSEQINEIVNVITGIADQTNLLALNAAIEAARAGDVGRGFAVVAEEVRKLAEGSAKATDQISSLIREIQKETTQAVTAMEIGSKQMTEGRDVVGRASEALGEIAKVVEDTAAMVEQISAASQQMAAGTKQVVKSVDDIAATSEEAASATEEASASTEEMSASMEEMTASAMELSEMATGLRELVGKFKLGNGKPSPRLFEQKEEEPQHPKSFVPKPIVQRLRQDRERLQALRGMKTDVNKGKPPAQAA